ncbi:MAG: glycosyltransferase [Deltaproteobacteria bacterium]|nr:glycosyltransferase [Deltaproteobacteria bacterium]
MSFRGPELSVVIPTLGRPEGLARCLEALPQAADSQAEILVVASTGDLPTRRMLAGRRDLKLILEERPEGAVRAFNRGFQAATGKWLTWLNDDAYPLPGAFQKAMDFLQRPENRKVGLAALYHTWEVKRNWADQVEHDGRGYGVFHVRGTLYANFGLGRRELFEELGWWDHNYYFWGGDPDFSLKVWEAGYEVKGCPEALICHDCKDDTRRRRDEARARADNERLFAKWDLPPKNTRANDFDPERPCKLRGRRPGWEFL